MADRGRHNSTQRMPSRTAARRRGHERWPLQREADISTGTGTLCGQVHDLSLSGAFLACRTMLPIGTGLHLAFRLPSGLPVNATGRVVRIQPEASPTRPAGVGIAFDDLDDVSREIICNYFGSDGAEPCARQGDVALEEKFRVETDHDERVYLWLSGFLDRHECESLIRTLLETLGKLRGAGLRLCINAVHYQCCSPESVEHFKRCFDALAGRERLVAALVGTRSVGIMQMRRAARDANVADSFASFEDVDEALEFLELVEW